MYETRSRSVPNNGGQGGGSTSTSQSVLAAAWIQAVQDSTACLANNDNVEHVAASMAYLFQLESLLQPLEPLWDQPPPFTPPPFRPYDPASVSSRDADNEHGNGNDSKARGGGGVPAENRPGTRTPAYYLHNNPYASIHDDDEDDEAGDLPTWNPEAVPDAVESSLSPTTTTTTANIASIVVLNMRRLLIRILTTQSDLYAYLARDCRHSRNWSTGADHCLAAVQRIHQAVLLADSEISRLWNQDMQADTHNIHTEGLVKDADTCQVAVQHLTQEKDRFQQAAEKQAASLTNKLEPQWAGRDEVKSKMGDDKWRNNPRPKNDYAATRRALEQELRDLQPALEKLGALDTGALAQSAMDLQQRLGKQDATQSWTSQQRYNGQRPTDTSRRVDEDHYPDPQVFGWTFTGSWDNVVEFFEKPHDTGGVVKLDWYFTTGTVKTSLDHPRQGKTQLFGAKVDPEVYADILVNPRSHTSERYHTKDQRPANQGRGRGRNQGRGFGRGRGRGIQ
jgi:hypothetical protein